MHLSIFCDEHRDTQFAPIEGSEVHKKIGCKFPTNISFHRAFSGKFTGKKRGNRSKAASEAVKHADKMFHEKIVSENVIPWRLRAQVGSFKQANFSAGAAPRKFTHEIGTKTARPGRLPCELERKLRTLQD
jgi:hypothetical protein